VNIQPTDSIAMTAAAPAIPAGIASSSSVICHTTVTNLPFDPSLDYQCNETYNQYVTSCSLDKTVSIVRVPDCNAAIASNTLGDMSHGPMIKCGTSPTLKVNLGTVPEYKQCHGGGCNSDYYNFTMTIVPGTRSGICLGLQVNYQGRTWVYMCANYDGGTTVTVPPFFDGSYDYIWMGSGRNGGYQSINHMNPGGFLTFTGGHYLRPEVSNGSDINNCTSLSGLLQ
jgi:hypothetical protein